jgi:fructose-1,6-bisphosphatase
LNSFEVSEVLTKIVCRYDVLAVLEVVDSSGVSLRDLLHRVNERMEDLGDKTNRYKSDIESRAAR